MHDASTEQSADSGGSEVGSQQRFSFPRGLCRGATILGIFLTAFTFLAESNWFADLIVNFRFQFALVSAVLVLCLLLFRSWWFAVLCFVGFLVNAWPIAPYFAPGEVNFLDQDPIVRVMTLNVLTKNRNWKSVTDLIKKEDPDVLVLMEVDSTWEQVLSSIGTAYPHQQVEARSDNFGIALLSKHRWDSVEVFKSGVLQLPSIDARFIGRGPYLDRKVQILATHPIPPMGPDRWAARNEQLFNVASRMDPEFATVMTGDFNVTPWSPAFQKLVSAGLHDSAIGFGVEPTWHIFPTWIGGLKLDHVLVDSQIGSADYHVGPDVGSDHRAVIVDLVINGG